MRDTLTTDRLVLRQIELRDAEAFSTLGSDFDIARMTGSFPHPFPLLSAFPYAITRAGDDTLIGVSDLFKRGEDTLWEIGYWIGRPYWGQGFMTEACTALLTEADATLGAQDRVAGVFTDNPGSARVLEKLGFEREGQPELHFSMGRLKKAESQDFVLKARADD